ncbi:hypothetical protein NDU88_005227 [Pleurodeles waltl]|uniref:Uncharacterized protein n=1 Tax=Pleurodeles waltl TaxID=8319 RepID=A0AAV7TV07_PLEWA|nr:hypothetical protein NDU88_005227 [Pleurodeles waltl]
MPPYLDQHLLLSGLPRGMLTPAVRRACIGRLARIVSRWCPGHRLLVVTEIHLRQACDGLSRRGEPAASPRALEQ